MAKWSQTCASRWRRARASAPSCLTQKVRKQRSHVSVCVSVCFVWVPYAPHVVLSSRVRVRVRALAFVNGADACAGPEIRTGKLKGGLSSLNLTKDTVFVWHNDLTRQGAFPAACVCVCRVPCADSSFADEGTETEFFCSYGDLATSVKPGSKILCSDALLSFTVKSCDVESERALFLRLSFVVRFVTRVSRRETCDNGHRQQCNTERTETNKIRRCRLFDLLARLDL